METQKRSKTRSTQWQILNKNSGEGMEGSLSQEIRKWEDLHFDILVKIFSGVPLSDLSRNVILVCRSWQISCWHFLQNNVLDLSVIKDVLAEVQPAAKAMVMLKSILEDKLSIRKVLIPRCLEISDEHLIYIAERTIGIDELVLLGCLRITGRGLGKAILNWKNIRSLHLGKVEPEQFGQIIKEIGKNCYILETVSLSMPGFHLFFIYADLIVENLVRVKEISFHHVVIHFLGIRTIFQRIFHKVQLRNCILSCTCFLEDEYFRRDWWNCSSLSMDFTLETIKLGKQRVIARAREGTDVSIWNDWWAMMKSGKEPNI